MFLGFGLPFFEKGLNALTKSYKNVGGGGGAH